MRCNLAYWTVRCHLLNLTKSKKLHRFSNSTFKVPQASFRKNNDLIKRSLTRFPCLSRIAWSFWRQNADSKKSKSPWPSLNDTVTPNSQGDEIISISTLSSGSYENLTMTQWKFPFLGKTLNIWNPLVVMATQEDTQTPLLAGETLKTAENTLGTVHTKKANQTLETEPWALATSNSPMDNTTWTRTLFRP